MKPKSLAKRIVPKQLWTWLHITKQKALVRFAPVAATKKHYKACMHKDLDLKHPRDLNEKVLWLKLYSDTSRWPLLADKYRVRKYVEACGLGHLLNHLYGVWDDPRKIDFNNLPQSFVLKLNNGSGDIVIVRDKDKMDREQVVKMLCEERHRHHGLSSVETHYLKIKPCVIAERLLEADTAYSSSLIDYKFPCFYGEPACAVLCIDRKNKIGATKIVYDLDWTQRLDHTQLEPQKAAKCPPPKSLNRMIEACRILGKPFPFVRIDFYDVEGEPFFGEMTFVPACGCSKAFSPDYMIELGNKIDITKCHK